MVTGLSVTTLSRNKHAMFWSSSILWPFNFKINLLKLWHIVCLNTLSWSTFMIYLGRANISRRWLSLFLLMPIFPYSYHTWCEYLLSMSYLALFCIPLCFLECLTWTAVPPLIKTTAHHRSRIISMVADGSNHAPRAESVVSKDIMPITAQKKKF